MLRLETNGAAAREGGAMLSFVTICPVVCVQLYAWFRCIHFHGAAALWISQPGSEGKFAFFFLVQHEAVIVSGTIFNLRVVCFNVLTDGLWLAEVKWGSLHKSDFTGWNGCVVDRNIVICIDFTDLVFYYRRGIRDALQ